MLGFSMSRCSSLTTNTKWLLSSNRSRKLVTYYGLASHMPGCEEWSTILRLTSFHLIQHVKTILHTIFPFSSSCSLCYAFSFHLGHHFRPACSSQGCVLALRVICKGDLIYIQLKFLKKKTKTIDRTHNLNI